MNIVFLMSLNDIAENWEQLKDFDHVVWGEHLAQDGKVIQIDLDKVLKSYEPPMVDVSNLYNSRYRSLHSFLDPTEHGYNFVICSGVY